MGLLHERFLAAGESVAGAVAFAAAGRIGDELMGICIAGPSERTLSDEEHLAAAVAFMAVTRSHSAVCPGASAVGNDSSTCAADPDWLPKSRREARAINPRPLFWQESAAAMHPSGLRLVRR